MNRRLFLALSSTPAKAQSPANGPPDLPEINPWMNKVLPSLPRVSSGIESYTGPWGFDQAAHLLRRATFGATGADIAVLAAKNVNDAVNQLLAPVAAPPPPAAPSDEVDSNKNLIGAKAGDTWTTLAYNSTLDSQRNLQLASWWVGLMLNQGISIVEKMTLFLHNHFVSEYTDVVNAQFMYGQNSLFRRYALGNFRNLARDVTLDPAMLIYLNGNTNTAKSPNENYGRELQELFTIGKGPEIAPGNYTNYTEDDVKAAAKVLTGWAVRRSPTTSPPAPAGTYFIPGNHDATNKKFSSDYGGVTITGRSTEAGARQELDDLLAMIFGMAETARFIVRKLYRWFVYYMIDPATEANVIEPLAAILRNGNYELAPVLSTLFKSAHFYDPLNMGCLIKSPIDHLAGTMRLFSVKMPDPATQPVQLYNAWNLVRQTAANMLQIILAPPNVAGWPAYYQEPMFHELWITSDTLPKRNQFTDTMIGNGVTVRDQGGKNGVLVRIDPFLFLQNVSDPSDVYTLIADTAKLLISAGLSPAQTDLCGEALMGTTQYYEWNNAVWQPYATNPTPQNKANVEAKLRSLFKYIMDMAEYQLS